MRQNRSFFFNFPGKDRVPVWLLFFACILFFGACDDPVIRTAYTLEFPPPPGWAALLGPPFWHIEWINREGKPESMEYGGYGKAAAGVLLEWANPVIAYPYWPQRGLKPGVFRPAGALFPYDVQGDRLRLSWNAGVEAWFYREMLAAGASGKRDPRYFDWPRFRALLADPVIHEDIRRDPWIADWPSITRRTLQSGFDRRRITAAPREDLPVTLPHGGPWMGTSPFAVPLVRKAGESVLFRVTGDIDTYISPAGILRCTAGAWIWLPWEPEPGGTGQNGAEDVEKVPGR
jgi:hypothetical protein